MMSPIASENKDPKAASSITIMDDLKCALLLNNAGIGALMEGQRRRAFELFRNAFDIISSCAAGEEDCKVDPLGYQEVVYPASVYQAKVPFIPVSVPGIKFTTEAAGNSDDDVSCQRSATACGGTYYRNQPQQAAAYTFGKVFLFHPMLELERDCVDSFRAVMLYNMALLYHNASVNPHDEYEATALALYETCLELLERDDCPDDLACVYIGALNNTIQIHHGRADLATTQTLLDDLGTILRETLKRKDGHQHFLDDQDIHGLLLNVTCQRALICAAGA